jgi:hypothetical protein
MDDDEGAKPSADVVLVHSPTEDGEGARVLRLRENRVEVGEVRALEEGKPIAGEIVRLKPRDEEGRVCDVEVLVPKVVEGPKKGPAQVSTDAYRDSWTRIFSERSPSAAAPKCSTNASADARGRSSGQPSWPPRAMPAPWSRSSPSGAAFRRRWS